MESFWALTDQGGPMPSFRPLVRTPELQTLMMREANDLSETAPRPYIINNTNDKRDKKREAGLQAEWRRAQINYHAMYASLMSMFTGTCFLQIGYDPEKYNGKGGIWGKMRSPDTVSVDPFTSYELDWSYVILEDRMHIERVRKIWGNTSKGIRPRIQGKSMSPAIGDSGYGFQMPPGPMAQVPGLPNNRSIPDDNRVRVRWCFCEDYTREKIESKLLPDGAMIDADFEWKYPNGRLVVECEGHILQDGDNPYPMKMFPIIPFWSTLPLYNFWAVPAVRYSKDVQNVSERLWTQLFENAIRLNNGTWFIQSNTGIDPDSFGGMPGEVQIINANSAVPECKFPNPMPAQFTQLPQLLLDKQKELQGFTEARSGKPGAGNISPELFDESVVRSQGLTQLRGRLNALSFQRISELMFYTMARYYRRQSMPLRGDHGMETIEWESVPRPDEYDVYLDESSIRPMSQAIIRKIAPELAKIGKIDDLTLLESLDFPDAGGIAERNQRQLELMALSKTKGNKK